MSPEETTAALNATPMGHKSTIGQAAQAGTFRHWSPGDLWINVTSGVKK